jgi:N-acetylneuraminic acid mutarotase
MRYVSTALIAVLWCGAAAGEEHRFEIADIAWTLGPNLPEFRKGGSATVLDGKVISVFGMRQPWGEMPTMYVYDPRVNWWQRAPDAPLGQTYVQGAECQDAFYAIGGRSRERGGVHKQCYRLRSKDGKYAWDRIVDLNVKRAWAPSVSLGDKLFVFGGSQGGHGPTLKSVEMLDTSKREPQWRKLSDIPGDSRGWSGAAAVGGGIFLIGGSHFFDPKPTDGPDRKRFNEVWRFDPDTSQWQARKPLPYRLAGFDCCVYKDRYIIVVGGAAETGDFTPEMRKILEQDRFHKSYYCPFVLVYDTLADRWYRMPSVLPVPTNDIRVVIIGNMLYGLGGENVEPATSNTTPWLRIGTIHVREESN